MTKATIPSAEPSTHRPSERHRLRDARCLRQRRFDFGQLDAVTEHLDLMIDASEIDVVAVRQLPHAIAGAIEAVGRAAGDRIVTNCSAVFSGSFQ